MDVILIRYFKCQCSVQRIVTLIKTWRQSAFSSSTRNISTKKIISENNLLIDGNYNSIAHVTQLNCFLFLSRPIFHIQMYTQIQTDIKIVLTKKKSKETLETRNILFSSFFFLFLLFIFSISFYKSFQCTTEFKIILGYLNFIHKTHYISIHMAIAMVKYNIYSIK